MTAMYSGTYCTGGLHSAEPDYTALVCRHWTTLDNTAVLSMGRHGAGFIICALSSEPHLLLRHQSKLIAHHDHSDEDCLLDWY